MKKFYSLILIVGILILTGQSRAQTTLTQAVDFTVTDVDGNVHNLFNILNNGQHVCIDFFFDTCGPCQITSPYFKQTYNNFGCNNEDIYFIAIDVGDTDPEVVAYENTFLGGSPGYPSVSGINGGGNAVVSAYGIGAFPTYILIRPDQTIVEQDMWPISNATTFTTYFANHALSPVPCTVGLNDVVDNSSTSIYPNPASDMLNIKSPLEVQNYRVYNIIGETVLEGVNSTQKNAFNQVDVSHLDNGIYVIEIGFREGTGRYRFTKQ